MDKDVFYLNTLKNQLESYKWLIHFCPIKHIRSCFLTFIISIWLYHLIYISCYCSRICHISIWSFSIWSRVCLHLFMCNAHIWNVNPGMISYLSCCISCLSPSWMEQTLKHPCDHTQPGRHVSASQLKLAHGCGSSIKWSLVYLGIWLHGTGPWKHEQKHKKTIRSQPTTPEQRWNGANTHQVWVGVIPHLHSLKTPLLPGSHITTFCTTGSSSRSSHQCTWLL